jgi:hypothetical protein
MLMAMKAGAAKVNITPPLGIKMFGYFEERLARDVHDDLHAKSLVLGDGEVKLAVVVCDLIGVSREYLDRAKALINERCGIPPSNVLISCTHTHTGPLIEDMGYGDVLAQRIADSVQVADNRLAEAELGCERVEEPKPLANRRYMMKVGTVWTNPGTHNPDIVRPAGPVDPEVGVLCAREPNGSTISLLVNYAMHYAGLSPTEKREDMYTISADYFGVFSEMIQRMRGEEFVAILANGTCGDIGYNAMNPPKGVNKYFGDAERTASLVAAEAHWAWNQMEFHSSMKLRAAMEELTIPRRMPTRDEVELSRKFMSGEAEPKNMAHYALKYFFGPKIGELQSAPREARTWVQVLAIGDLVAIVGLPGEVFVEHGLRIKKGSPFKHTLILELANDGWPNIGYVPTLKAFEDAGAMEASGSYETTAGVNMLSPKAGDMMVASATRMLNELYKS